MGNYLKKPIIDEAVQSGRLGNVNYASNTIQVCNLEFGLGLGSFWAPGLQLGYENIGENSFSTLSQTRVTSW